MYKKVSTDMNFVGREKEVEAFWKEHDIFQKSMEEKEGCPEYTFYDGPPTANGKPHIGHFQEALLKKWTCAPPTSPIQTSVVEFPISTPAIYVKAGSLFSHKPLPLPLQGAHSFLHCIFPTAPVPLKPVPALWNDSDEAYRTSLKSHHPEHLPVLQHTGDPASI